jgi:hypothetical protein
MYKKILIISIFFLLTSCSSSNLIGMRSFGVPCSKNHQTGEEECLSESEAAQLGKPNPTYKAAYELFYFRLKNEQYEDIYQKISPKLKSCIQKEEFFSKMQQSRNNLLLLESNFDFNRVFMGGITPTEDLMIDSCVIDNIHDEKHENTFSDQFGWDLSSGETKLLYYELSKLGDKRELLVSIKCKNF